MNETDGSNLILTRDKRAGRCPRRPGGVYGTGQPPERRISGNVSRTERLKMNRVSRQVSQLSFTPVPIDEHAVLL